MKKTIFSFFVLILISIFSCRTDGRDNQGSVTEADTTLKTLVIKRDIGVENRVTSPVPRNYSYRLNKDISKTNKLIIEAEANDSKATIYFDGKSQASTSQRYERYKAKISIKVKNGTSSSTYTINVEKPQEDISLQSLTIHQARTQVQMFREPVELTNSFKLPKVVDGLNYITVIATPKASGTDVYFDGESIARTSKDYVQFQAQIKIKVKKGSQEKEYTLNLEEPEDETGMLKLVVKQKDAKVEELNSNIPKVINVELLDKINTTNFVTLEVSPKDSSAEVLFDGVSTPSKNKRYESYQETVKITIKKGSKEADYKVRLKEPSAPIPQDSSVVKCNVVDSLGGTNVNGAKVKVFEHGSETMLKEGTTNAEGDVYFALQGEKYYTFVISKTGSAGSRVESVYLPPNKRIFLPIIMREAAKGALAIAPEVSEIIIRHKGDEKPLERNHKIDFSKLTDGTVIQLTVKSKSKKVIPAEVELDSRNFGAAASIGSPLTTASSGIIPLRIVPTTSGSTITIDPSDGTVTQKFSLYLNKLAIEDGENNFYFTIYDVAGNRCEYHQRITFNNARKMQNVENPNDKFGVFSAYSQRYYRSLGTFGMPTEDDTQTSLRVMFEFKFEPNVDIEKIDLLRRPYQEGSPAENWEVVYTKHYENNFKGENEKGLFKLSDASGSLKDGEVYQYKLEAYNSRGKITSPIATIKVMEAFNIFLTTPVNRSEVPLTNIANQDFAFKISKKSLWSSSDYFYFDVLIHAEDMYPNTDNGLMFAAMLKYNLNGTKDLEVGKYVSLWDKSRNYKRFTDYGTSVTNIDDLVAYNDGMVTIKNRFFNEDKFNLVNTTLAGKITKAGMYYWDIMHIGKDPLGTRDLSGNFDDKAAYFVKEYPYLDSKTGKPLQGEKKARSYSYSNLDIIGGAVNGKALFIVK
ncbi:MAG: dentilisin complex subunit PrcA [Treponema sp.]